MLVLCFLSLSKFKILKFQSITDIDTEGEKGYSNLRNYTGGIVFNIGIIAAYIDNGTKHNEFSL